MNINKELNVRIDTMTGSIIIFADDKKCLPNFDSNFTHVNISILVDDSILLNILKISFSSNTDANPPD